MSDAADSTKGGAEDAPPDAAPLPDGSYDVFIIDADHDPTDEGTVVIEVTLLDGEHKAEVLAVGCPASELVPGGADPIELLGEIGVLAVVDGAPRFQLDR